MASPIEPFMPYLNTFIFFGAYTILYKNNPIYRVTQSLIVGIGAGYLFIRQIDAFNKNVISQTFIDGTFNPAMILPWIIGISYLTIFSQKTINIYRTVSILAITVGMGIALPYAPAVFWTSTLAYGQGAFNFLSEGISVATIGNLVTAIAYVCGISYFFFTETVSKPTVIPRKIGRLVLLIYTAFTIVTTALGKVNLVQWKMLDAIQGVPATWWIPALMFIIMLVDNFYPLKNLVSRT
jgi:hypothetical protein